MKKQEAPKEAAKKTAAPAPPKSIPPEPLAPKAPAAMQRYRTVGLKTGIPAGVLIGLARDQYTSRKHALSVVEEGIYLTESSLEFMNGEIISLYEVGIGMVANLEAVK